MSLNDFQAKLLPDVIPAGGLIDHITFLLYLLTGNSPDYYLSYLHVTSLIRLLAS